ncbi:MULTISPECIES: phosphoglucosamine mutase [Methylococcus]|uniref:Phosphoglucosamine mutase n=2 Tax=Methylococcus capsulatus TaxID=414 RepID=GLMM_METCA|nr:phosphoglucosamine mutase [Methylococcus capsulatus]Q607B4.1 RecName: Full=Phosphoglucosamine mutase [Methylococcus capsulatus str. Bath]AAU91923.1 phosphoglucosamine mutase [Methylococcus capsulatus str. Bath]QXP87506.1 phosphoglucosamine mutase [Methylococcus capsulatus]QXP91140.1 phosphoglucosamine mutase [Methylococcus capsulatus]QXP92754.1 phosphoglucosamine mutase [Methylococcus capsulatus]UQN12517.1 phosphoglucosamine mutase [Methylococcus capsulatus]
MKKEYFGTDGIRGRVGDYPITPDFMLKLGWAAGCVFAREMPGRRVLIGKDTRISGYMFESALEAGFSAAGVDTQLLGPMPTPAVAYLTRTLRAQAGVVISASHNPYYDNGIKFFGPDGMKLPDELELLIEDYLGRPMTTVECSHIGKATRIVDAAGRYIEFCKSTIPLGMHFSGMKIVVDCAHGSTYHVAPDVFSELRATVSTLGVAPDGLNINDRVGATDPENLRQTVLEENADLGIALDGDGDRLIMVDHRGEVVDGDELLFVIANARHAEGELKGSVVGTLMSNLGLEQAIRRLGLEFRRAAVGDRYVMEMMLEHGSMLGGEGSGHIICRDRTTTGDGIVSALQVLAEIVRSGKTLHELKQGMRKYPQRLVNVRLAERVSLASVPLVQKVKAEVEAELGDSGRVLLRPSGTEPLIRVMVEGADEGQVRELADRLAGAVARAFSA